MSEVRTDQPEEPQEPEQRHFRLKDAKRLAPPTMMFEIERNQPDGSKKVVEEVFEMIDVDSMSLLDEAEMNILDGKGEDGQEVEEKGIRGMMPTLRKQVAIIFYHQLPVDVVNSLRFHQLQYIMQSFLGSLTELTTSINEGVQASTNKNQNRRQQRRNRRSRSQR